MLSDQFDVSDIERRMLDDERENDARLRGIMAMLALPAVQQHDGSLRRREVEIEIAVNVWQLVDGVIVEDGGRVVFFVGMNGHREEWTFDKGERVPRWRIDASVPRRAGPRVARTP